MLVELQLRNYKCFSLNTIPFRPTTIIVGQNNAGKSTIAEALRLVSIILNKLEYLRFRPVPHWLNAPKVQMGASPSLEHHDFDLVNIFHRYGDPPAEIIARFEGGNSLKVYLGGEEKIHAVLKDRKQQVITSGSRARRLGFPRMAILPPIGPVKPNEAVLKPDYVRRLLDSTLASIHFRNQLNLLYQDAFRAFKSVSESTWPGLQIQELRGKGSDEGQELGLMVRNDDFVAEVAWMGHGLQMWLQMMWFLARSADRDVVILDEPDIYMHADLQRKLIRFLAGRFNQVIVATHSVEIMAEVEPENILVVDRDRRQAQYASDVPEVQRVIDRIGGVHNLQLARLWNSRKCLFVEGDDLRLLRIFHNKLHAKSSEPIDALPHMSVGGWSGWPLAIGSTQWVSSVVRRDIASYCIFDSDFHTDEQIEKRYAEANERGIFLHIWKRKELENYLLVPGALHRAILKKPAEGRGTPTLEQVTEKLIEFANKTRDEIGDCFAAEYQTENRAGGVGAANKAARRKMARFDDDPETKLALCPGKQVMANFFTWAQTNYGVSLSAARVAQELRLSEINEEVKDVLSAIELREPFEGTIF